MKKLLLLTALFAAVFANALVVAQPGSVVPGGARGHAGKQFVDIATGNDRGQASALQPDGKLVVVGSCNGVDDRDFCIVRLNNLLRFDVEFDGSPGTGSNGVLVIRVGALNDSATAVAIQPDGKIVVGGTCDDGNETTPTTDFCFVRLLPGGALDLDFDGIAGTGNGIVRLSMSTGNDQLRSIAVQPDGKIVALGTCSTGGQAFSFCIARLMPNGTLDTSFTGPGVIAAGGKFLFRVTNEIDPEEDASAVLLQPDGKIVSVGTCKNAGAGRDFCVARFTPSGSWDSSFVGPNNNASGYFSISIQSAGNLDDYAYAAVLQPDAKILIAGACGAVATSDMCVARIQVNGNLDLQFQSPVNGDNGKFAFPVGTGADVARAVTLQTDGKLIFAGRCQSLLGTDDMCLVRLHADGAFDATFDGGDALAPGNGKVFIAMTANGDVAYDAHLRYSGENGNIVIAGTCNNTVSGNSEEFCAAELIGGAHGAMRCSLDIDGNGAYEAATDGVIAARIALGFRGVGVIDGLSFVNAPRSSWAEIRDFLSSQCGLSIE
jgi:uncharacterized delta-60 repeat protein